MIFFFAYFIVYAYVIINKAKNKTQYEKWLVFSLFSIIREIRRKKKETTTTAAVHSFRMELKSKQKTERKIKFYAIPC